MTHDYVHVFLSFFDAFCLLSWKQCTEPTNGPSRQPSPAPIAVLLMMPLGQNIAAKFGHEILAANESSARSGKVKNEGSHFEHLWRSHKTSIMRAIMREYFNPHDIRNREE